MNLFVRCLISHYKLKICTFMKQIINKFCSFFQVRKGDRLIKENNISNEIILILGFFNRGNIGDQAFIQPYKMLFPNNILHFESIDDVHNIPSETSVVIIAGGDVINDYFMKKIRVLLKGYDGPCYAFSVGIPYVSEAHYTSLFDHVILRAKQDILITDKIIGDKNVTYLPDITWMLKSTLPLCKSTKPNKNIKIGICLAQPLFHNNSNEISMINELVRFINTLVQKYNNCEINLITFNTSVYSQESDYIINEKVFKRVLNNHNVHNCTSQELRDPIQMLKFIGSHNVIVGMRFHSLIFSLIQSVPCVCVYSTRKVDNLVKDFELYDFAYKLPVDNKFKPTELSCDNLISLVEKRLNTPYKDVIVDVKDFDYLKDIVTQKKRKQILVKSYYDRNYDNVMIKTIQMIKTYLKIDDIAFEKWSSGQILTKHLLTKVGKDEVDFARLICFGIINKIGCPYIWGLKDNMLKDDFKIIEAIKWIYEDFSNKVEILENSNNYYPILNPIKNIIIDINFMCQDNYQGLHRSGWSYVISGLQHLDTQNVEKPAVVLVDTCVERTFLWGLDVTKTANIVPYKKDWVGFVHHTFDPTYSKFNCTTLLTIPEFIESLSYCKCLITLSNYLKKELQIQLRLKGFTVQVISTTHPTEFVNKTFEIGNFLNNKNRKVLHIGAWLRNPYAIYALPVPENNRLNISKVALKGKEMDNYFRPPWVFDKLFDMLQEYNDAQATGQLCRPEYSMCRPYIVNKYLEGMFDRLQKDDKSVQIIDFIGDNDYDNLLSENIVFLNLVDASASNTVIECIVRNTPIIINRLPALEEELGTNYPGFYSSLYEAASKIIDMNHILLIHEYLKHIDKKKYTLDYFINDFQIKLTQCL